MSEDDKKPGCLMARMASADAARFYLEVNKMVPEGDVDVSAGGYERDTHTTVLFGFDYGFSASKLKKYLATQKPFHITLAEIGLFKKDDGGAVLKVAVQSQQLEDLHYALVDEFSDDITETFPDYKPHVTLAYLKPGAESFKLDGSTKFSGETYYFTDLVFSYGTSAMRSAVICPLGSISESVRRVLNQAPEPKG